MKPVKEKKKSRDYDLGHFTLRGWGDEEEPARDGETEASEIAR